MNLLRATLLLAVPALHAAAEPAAWAPIFTMTAGWNSNVTNSDRSADVIGALQCRAQIGADAWRISPGHDDTLLIGVAGQVEIFPRFDGLDQWTAGPRLAWRHKFGLGAFVPVLSFELDADGIAARDDGRSGYAGRARLVWRQRCDEATQLSLSYERTREDTKETVWARTGGEAAVNFTRELDEHWRLVLAARWREGDVISYATPPRPDLVALARVRSMEETFGAPRVAYSITGRTLGGAVNLVRQLDERSSLALGYEDRTTTHSPLRYVNHLVSTAFTRQF